MTRKFAKQTALVGAAIIGLLAASFFFRARLPHGTDTLFHLYTLIQLDYLMDQGIFFTRWFPYQAGGLGLPLFQYYPPLGFYIAQLFNRAGLATLPALQLAFGLTLVGSAVGVYLWTRAVFKQESAALVATAAYVCSPYLLYNAYFRGGFAEQFALMLMPWVLWSFWRLAHLEPGGLVLAGLTYAGLILAHSLTAFIFTPVLGLYLLVLGFDQAKPRPGRLLLKLGAALSLGLGLAAFFWLPALIEREAIVTWFERTPELDYRRNFMSLSTLFAWPLAATARPALSSIAVGLALIALWHRPRLVIGWAVVVTLLTVTMALPLSAAVWNAWSLLPLLQFPHRFLGVATLTLAFLAGAGVAQWQRLIPQPSWQAGLALLLLLALLGQLWLLRQVSYYPPLPAIDVQFIMQKDRESGQIGTLYIGNFVPATVKALPPPERLAQASAERLAAASLPVEAGLLAAQYQPLRYDLSVTSPRPWVAEFNTFYFPGWMATLDGEPWPVKPTDPYGLLSVAVPAGAHHVIIAFETTPVRRWAGLLSGGCLLVLLGLIVIKWA